MFSFMCEPSDLIYIEMRKEMMTVVVMIVIRSSIIIYYKAVYRFTGYYLVIFDPDLASSI